MRDKHKITVSECPSRSRHGRCYYPNTPRMKGRHAVFCLYNGNSYLEKCEKMNGMETL